MKGGVRGASWKGGWFVGWFVSCVMVVGVVGCVMVVRWLVCWLCDGGRVVGGRWLLMGVERLIGG